MSHLPPSTATTFPVNRVVAFFGPVIALAAGSAATWLGLHVPGLHLDPATSAAQIAGAIEFLVGAGVTLALQHKWLDGWQKWEATLQPIAPVVTPTVVFEHAVVSPEGSGVGSGTVVEPSAIETPTLDDPFVWRH